MELSGRPIYVWSLTTLLAVPAIKEVVMVVPQDLIADVEEQLDRLRPSFSEKALRVVPGGDTRQASVFCGLKSMKPNPPDFVLIHDAARPFLSIEVVERVIEGVTEYGACTTGIRPADTIKKTDGNMVGLTLDRDELLLVQTPQAGRFDWLISAHDQAASSGFATTDDAAILESASHKVGIVRGASFNIKITQPEDLILAEALSRIVLVDRL